MLSQEFPPPLASYAEPTGSTLLEALRWRVKAEPFNLVATLIFLLAIVHTFLAPTILRAAHRRRQEHERHRAGTNMASAESPEQELNFVGELLHFMGEIEAVFGIWVVPLLIAITLAKGWPVAMGYMGGLDLTEPVFVVVIMTMAASLPILQAAERLMSVGASLGRGSPAAWWFSVLTIGPILGSLITEPAAMTISALLLAKRFYQLRPTSSFAYATLGLLFVNVSVGGALTHFAAPPVLMVASRWNWNAAFMFTHFGWKALLGILVSNGLYLLAFRSELQRLAQTQNSPVSLGGPLPKTVPIWITGAHIFFLVWTVLTNHYAVLFVGGFLFYLAFARTTEPHQSELSLRPALMVGFFLAGLVIHGQLQGWWIQPVLSRLSEVPLFIGSALLTAFNDNAAITYLASLVPDFTEPLKYAVVAGAVAGGGLTVIANAPNPAGQSILAEFFPDGVSPMRLLLGALLPTSVMVAAFLFFR
jgi:hypothetical protein